MKDVSELKKGWNRLPREIWGALAVIIVMVGIVLWSGFSPYISTPTTFNQRIAYKLQRLDITYFLDPIRSDPLLTFSFALASLYAVGGYGWVVSSFKNRKQEIIGLVIAPLSWGVLAAALGSYAWWKGWTADPLSDAPYRFWSWILTAIVLAVLGNNAYVWHLCLDHAPRTLPKLLEQRHYYDLEDLGGAATLADFDKDPTSLLVRFPGCEWPNPENGEVRRLLKGRLVVGRYYERKTPTNWWVCPEILKMQQTLVVAPPGAGKTYAICLPWSRELPAQGHSAFVVDVKGSMAKTLLSQGHRVRPHLWLFDPSDPERSVRWNIFEEIDRTDPDALRLGTKLITQAIFGEISRGESQFWDRTEQGFIAAGLELLLRSNPQASPPDLARLFRSKETLIAQIAQLRAQMTEHPERYTPRDHDRFEYIESRLQLLLDDDRQKRFGFNELSQGVKIKLEPFENGHIERVTTNGTFRLAQLAASPSCMIFAAPLNMGDDAASLAAIAFRLLQLLMHGRYSSETHVHRIFFILDEFSKLRASTHESEVFLSTSREAGCVSVVILQEISQLDERSRDALLGDLRDCYILHGAARRTAEWFEAAFGKRRHIRASFTEQNSTSANKSSDGISLSATEEWVPVLAAREIRRTGGLPYGAWVSYKNYADQKPILVDMQRPPKSPT